MLITIDLPPGVKNHGTDLDSSGRYRDANFVRWQNGSLRPIGGSEVRKANAVASVPRGAIGWSDNSNDSRIAVGTHEKLYALNAASTVSDITPTGLAVGAVSAEINTGYGGGLFGAGTYGTERASDGVPQRCTTWALDTWGQYLLACSSADGKIYEWQLDGAVDAAVLSNAPINNKGIVVTDERFLFALGAGGNPRKVAWSDRENSNSWTPTITNQAGDLELQTEGEILQGLRIRSNTLILTTTDAHVASYLGPPAVYGFQRVGSSCGAVSRNCAVSVDEGAFWMGTQGFYLYSGSAVKELSCEVLDYVFNGINQAQISKVAAVHNSEFGEIWWFYPSDGSNENDRYVVYDYKEGHWNIGQMDRTAGFDSGVFTTPVWFDASGSAYNQEKGNNHSSEPFAETGPIMMGEGERITKVTKVIPDEKTQGEASLTFKARYYPNGPELTHGPYATANPTSVRFQGRQFRMRVTGSNLKDWRTGKMRLDVKEGGKR